MSNVASGVYSERGGQRLRMISAIRDAIVALKQAA
jgi:hypothetical protein